MEAGLTKVLATLKELPQQMEALGVQVKILSGSVYWVQNWWLQNEVFKFAHCTEADFHAVVVVSVEDGHANVRLMTTQINRNLDNGVPYQPDSDVALDGSSIILTKKKYHLRLPTSVLRQPNYKGNVGPHVIRWLRFHERLVNDDNATSIGHINIDVHYRELALAV